MKRIVVLASGRGSNFLALARDIREGKIDGRCVALIVDRKGTQAAVRAEEFHIPVSIVDYSCYPSKNEYEEELVATIRLYAPDLIVLAGYMRILGAGIIRDYSGNIMNIHPSLLPAFPGLNAQKQAILYGVKVSGCTVHFVDEGTDTGPVILQRCVPVADDDDEESLAKRILSEEHRAFPEAIALFCQDRLKIRNRTVIILPDVGPGTTGGSL
ncbi:MAG: phosphoribosylglycinamide formyltransferase [Methanocalculus sp. MSAO_Arc2]|uniref:phosphoribosylglycinamide formyltransferase n=1 Tax=Methanocalculus sp. MSAO_Arc2 TaxID=2293855 RepID=UPI000FED3CC5|nr:MAG: phosphoribosylglycinamide formyltransferase [Methanocalculus sp. MSAO_Arc2]